MALSDERKFATFRRGKVRDDIILARFRNTLRGCKNPDTGQPFTEDDIAIITQEDSRFFVEADAIDLYGQAIQQRAIWLADQVRPDRAASGFLKNFHGRLWLPDGFLAATGGSGTVLAVGSPGTIYTGSTTIGDPTANIARDPAGKRYQVLVTAVAGVTGRASLSMQAIDTGDSTNPLLNTIFTWTNPPLGTNTTATVVSNFSGGFNQETESEFAERIVKRIRYKPGAGNASQFRIWATQSNNAVQDAFIYATALHSGSVIVAVSQKRGTSIGPNAMVASIGTLTAATAYLVPPTSPVVPHGAHVLVTPMNPQPSNIAMTLAMPKGSTGGWVDVDPWPRYTDTYPVGVRVSSVSTPTSVVIETDVTIAGGVAHGVTYGTTVSGADLPAMMIWNDLTSSFEDLDVSFVTHLGPDHFRLDVNTAPTKPFAANDLISPKNGRADLITEVFESYFDSLGPSELVLTTDTRFIRAARFPRPDQEYPSRAGQSIIARLDDQLGGALSDSELNYISKNTPDVPSETLMVNGPNYLTLGRLGIYAFETS